MLYFQSYQKNKDQSKLIFCYTNFEEYTNSAEGIKTRATRLGGPMIYPKHHSAY